MGLTSRGSGLGPLLEKPGQLIGVLPEEPLPKCAWVEKLQVPDEMLRPREWPAIHTSSLSRMAVSGPGASARADHHTQTGRSLGDRKTGRNSSLAKADTHLQTRRSSGDRKAGRNSSSAGVLRS